MSEAANHANSATHGIILVKALVSSPGIIGIGGAALLFMVDWPKTAKEGFCRVVASGVASHLFGNAVLRTITHFADWIPPEEIQAGAYLLAGLPGWFLLSALVMYFKKNKSKNIEQIIKGLQK